MNAVGAMLIQHNRLRDVARAIVRGTESDEAEAEAVANHLVEANMKGRDRHGVGILPLYVRDYRAGYLSPNRHAKMLRDDKSLALFTGDLGYGQVIAREVMGWAVDRARSEGMAIAGLREVHDIGRVGAYGELGCAEGMISVTFVSARNVASQVCVAIPSDDPAMPIVLDLAANGLGSQSPGLGVIADMLASVLTGNATYREDPDGSAVVNAMLTIVFDPGRIADPASLPAQISAFVETMKSSASGSPEPVLIAGDRERITYAHRLAEGIPIDSATWDLIREAADTIGVGASRIEELAG